MAITKIQSESLNLADTYNFTGTVTGAGESNTPIFHISDTGQSVSNNTLTKLTFNTEVFDADNCWDTSTNKLTPPAGKYIIHFFCTHYGSLFSEGANLYIHKNGSQHMMPFSDYHRNAELKNSHHSSLWGSIIVEANGTDYFEFYYYGTTDTGNHTVTYKKIQGYKITD